MVSRSAYRLGGGTGSLDIPEERKTVVCRVGQYEIKVLLTLSNEFLGISEVKISRDFLSSQQKLATPGYIDAGEYYRDE